MVVTSRRPRRLAPAALAALALSACWPVPGGNADRTAHNPFESVFTPGTVAGLEPAWTADLGPGAVGPVMVDGGGVFVRAGQQVTRVSLASGAPAWTWSLPDDVPDIATVGEPMVVGGRVHVGYGLGNLGGTWLGTALDPVTGEPTPGPAASGLLQTARGSLVVGHTFSFGSGTPILVSYRLSDVASGTVGGGPVAIEQLGSASGDPRFTLGATAVYHAGTGLLADAGGWTQGGGVRAFALGAGTDCGPSGATVFVCPTWTTPLTGVSTHVVTGPGGADLYVGRSDGSVVALDAATGAVRWSVPVGAPVTGAPALAGGVLYVPTGDGDLVAVDAAGCGAATCTPLWTAAIDGTRLAQPAVAGDGDDAVVFVGTAGGELAAVAAAGCGAAECPGPLWQAPVGSAVTAGPAVSGGRVLVGTAAGRVAAFRLPPG